MKAILHVRDQIAFVDDEVKKEIGKNQASTLKAPKKFEKITETGISSAEQTQRSSQRVASGQSSNRVPVGARRQNLDKIVPALVKFDDGKVYQETAIFEYPEDAPVSNPHVTITADDGMSTIA